MLQIRASVDVCVAKTTRAFIVDLEADLEMLKSVNSELTITNTTLTYKFEILKKYVEENRQSSVPLASQRQILDESTQLRESNNTINLQWTL